VSTCGGTGRSGVIVRRRRPVRRRLAEKVVAWVSTRGGGWPGVGVRWRLVGMQGGAERAVVACAQRWRWASTSTCVCVRACVRACIWWAWSGAVAHGLGLP
jgi:hypothetical protein